MFDHFTKRLPGTRHVLGLELHILLYIYVLLACFFSIMNEPFVSSWKPILHMFVALVWTLKDPVKLLIFEFLKRRCLVAAFCQRLTVCSGFFFEWKTALQPTTIDI